MKADGQLASPSSLKLALQDDAYGLVAEFKRKSPGVGVLNAEAVPQVLCPGFAGAGAAAVSMQTNEAFLIVSWRFFARLMAPSKGTALIFPYCATM